MIDSIEILVEGGSGGSGLVSFRREKYVPFGGPDGGDGGRGGDVIIEASQSIADLSLLARKKRYKAGNGGQGRNWRKHGRRGDDLVIRIPIGISVFTKDVTGNEIHLTDINVGGERLLVARGGRGGLGNVHFATSVNQAPETAGKGEVGEMRDIILELKYITDICIIGCTNSGKSTLLAAVSRAKPEIADYPFTTRQPVMGVIQGDRRDFVIAEIPGIVAGAHGGKGLGNRFLRHVERTKLLIYLLDGTSPTVAGDLGTLIEEMHIYKSALCQKPAIVAVNKVDLVQVLTLLPEMSQAISKLCEPGWEKKNSEEVQNRNYSANEVIAEAPVFYVSAVTGKGVSELTGKVMEMVEQANQEEETTPQAKMVTFRPKPRLQSKPVKKRVRRSNK